MIKCGAEQREDGDDNGGKPQARSCTCGRPGLADGGIGGASVDLAAAGAVGITGASRLIHKQVPFTAWTAQGVVVVLVHVRAVTVTTVIKQAAH